jgi:MYXO-CTERM domain-containing protein
VEECDQLDDDCDGEIDEGDPDPCADCDDVDFDGDGWADCDECDDTDSAVHPGAEEICGDAIDEDCDGLAPPCAPVQLGAAQPPGGCDCRTTVAPGRGSLLAIVFGLALIRRRRRGAAAALLLAGCPGGAGTLTPYWGTLAGDGAAADFAAGSSRDAAIHRDESEGATHLAVVDAAGCDAYAAFLAQVAATRAALSDGLGSGDAATWAGWVCQDVAGAARDAFGGEGAFSALHVLTESAPGERARPAWVGAAPDGSEAEAAFDGFSMPAGTYVAGALQRTVADRGLLPDTALVPDDDGAARFLCQARVQAILASDRPVGEPPGRFATEAIAAAFDRFDHQFVFDAEARGEDGGATPIGLTHGDGGFDLLTFARVPDAEIAGAQHVAVRAEAASEEVCDGLGTALDLLWPARTEGAAP